MIVTSDDAAQYRGRELSRRQLERRLCPSWWVVSKLDSLVRVYVKEATPTGKTRRDDAASEVDGEADLWMVPDVRCASMISTPCGSNTRVAAGEALKRQRRVERPESSLRMDSNISTGRVSQSGLEDDGIDMLGKVSCGTWVVH